MYTDYHLGCLPVILPSIVETKYRPVILFDNAGIGHSTGKVDDDLAAMGDHVTEFLSLIDVKEVDIFGISLGGIVAPLVKLNWPKRLVRKLVLAGTGPTAVQEGMLLFKENEKSQTAGRAWWKRIHERSVETSGEERLKYPSEGLQDGVGTYDGLGELDGPILVANGYEDIMVPTVNNFVTSQKIPNALLLIYPGAGHGFCFQYPEHFARQVVEFLDEWN
ncbi:alpha/beta-hydrolase [Acephala macrosclerotiorum]|nr:alpha/beta-hydrolase [Acephala macrosclerotiorum]